MQRYVEEGFVVADTVTFSDPKGGYITVSGQIQCLGGLNIDVDKKLRIVDGSGGNVRVTTSAYSYNVSVSGRGSRLRYDSAHNHRAHHHVHRFDAKGQETSIVPIHDVNDVPTLGDVIEETRDFYWSPEFSQETDGSDDDSEDGDQT